jgi:hypothetical protein
MHETFTLLHHVYGIFINDSLPNHHRNFICVTYISLHHKFSLVDLHKLYKDRAIGLVLDSIHRLVCGRQKTTTFRRLDVSPFSGGRGRKNLLSWAR